MARVGPLSTVQHLRASRRSFAFAVAAVTAFVVALGARSLGRPLWRDEVVSALLADRSLSDFWRVATSAEANMAGFYLALRAWLGPLEESVSAMRTLALLGTAASVVATTALARRHVSKPAAVMCGLVVGLVLVASGLSIEVRPYPWLPAIAATLAIVAAQLLEAPTVRRAGAYAALVVAGVSFHLVMAPFVVANLVAALLHRRTTRGWRQFVVANLVAGVAVAPLVPVVVAKSSSQTNWLKRFTIESVLYPQLGGPARAFAVVTAAVVAAAVIGVGIWRIRTGRHGVRGTLLALDAVVPIGMLVALSFLVPLSSLRYAIPVLPAAAVVAARALPQRQVATAALGIPGVVAAVWVLVNPPAPYQNENLRAAAETVAHASEPGDGLVFVPSFAGVGAQYYLEQASDGRLPEMLAARSTTGHVVYPPPPRLDALRAEVTHRRVWVMGYPGDRWRPSGVDESPTVRDEIGQSRRLGFRARFGDLVVERYDR